MNPWLPFEWIVALRFLREGRLQTLFIIGGVAIGVAVIVFMSALLSGLQANLTKRVLTSQSHITLQPRDEIARLASPRTTSADPVAAGDTTSTGGIVRICATTFCH